MPILIVVSKQPDFSVTEFLSIKQLYKASPLGVVAAIIVGAAHGTLWGIGSIYGLKSGLNIEQVSVFMFTFIIGGALNQYLIGYLSDIYDRRVIILIVSFLASLFAVFAVIFNYSFIYYLYLLLYLADSLFHSIHWQLHIPMTFLPKAKWLQQVVGYLW